MVAAGIPFFQLKERTTCYVSASDSFTHGATDKWERELFNLRRIFARPQLNGLLPRQETKRLLSMCHFHLTQQAFVHNDVLGVNRHGWQSFLLCPAGYNGHTNKPLAIMILYMLPLIGSLIRKLVNLLKRLECINRSTCQIFISI
jgi:hypothetical protein